MILFEQFLSINKDTIIKPQLGTLSLKDWEPTLMEMYDTIKLFDTYYSKIDSFTQEKLSSLASTFISLIENLIDQNDQTFSNSREQYINKIEQTYNQLKLYTPYFVSIAILDSGLLDKENKIKEIDSKIETLTLETDNSLKSIKIASEKIISEATKKAQEIENSARNTSKGISLKAAQDQFGLAINNNKKNIWIWGIISAFLLICLILFLMYLFFHDYDYTSTGKVIYKSIIRVTIIGFFGTFIAFSLKLLKSYLHLKEVNQHRMRLSNSMAAFVESASSQEHRDIILSKLIESVSDFGNSGMIGKEEENNSKVSIDNITRSISAIKSANEI